MKTQALLERVQKGLSGASGSLSAFREKQAQRSRSSESPTVLISTLCVGGFCLVPDPLYIVLGLATSVASHLAMLELGFGIVLCHN